MVIGKADRLHIFNAFNAFEVIVPVCGTNSLPLCVRQQQDVLAQIIKNTTELAGIIRQVLFMHNTHSIILKVHRNTV